MIENQNKMRFLHFKPLTSIIRNVLRSCSIVYTDQRALQTEVPVSHIFLLYSSLIYFPDLSVQSFVWSKKVKNNGWRRQNIDFSSICYKSNEVFPRKREKSQIYS